MGLQKSWSRTRDDRGREVVLRGFRPSVTQAIREMSEDPALADLRVRANAAVHRGIFSVRTLLLPLGVSVAFLAWAVFRVRSAGPPTAVDLMVTAIGLVVIIGTFAGMDVRTYRAKRSTIIRAFLAEGRCPACGYILGGTPPSAEGDVQCPECQAAWKADWVGRPQCAVALLRPPRWALVRAWERLADKRRLRGRIVPDLRGRVVRIPDPLLLRIQPGCSAHLSDDRIMRVRMQVRQRARGGAWTRLLLYAAALFVPLILRFAGITPARPGAPIGQLPVQLGVSCVVMIVLAGIGYGLFVGDWAIRPEIAAEVFAEHGICPACLSPLERLTNQPAAACGACGGLWRIGEAPEVLSAK